jgi:hypothetical protein
MKRTVPLVLVVLLSMLCTATASHAYPGFQTASVVSLPASLNTLWNWLSTALPGLAGVAKPAPTASAKDVPPPPPPTPVVRTWATCTDPDGARVPCAPLF